MKKKKQSRCDTCQFGDTCHSDEPCDYYSPLDDERKCVEYESAFRSFFDDWSEYANEYGEENRRI